MSDPHHDDYGGLHRDLRATLDRRGMLRLGARFGAAFGALQLVGCGDSPTSPTPTTATTATATTTTTTPVTTTGTCSRIPQETAQITLASDNVFSDGSALELATTTGDISGGFTATLTVAI